MCVSDMGVITVLCHTPTERSLNHDCLYWCSAVRVDGNCV